jgi:E2F-associated phosphoprotein.
MEPDDWTPSTEKLKIVEINANDEFFLDGLKTEDFFEFYDPVKDLIDQKWADEKYGKTSKVLSCPKCFNGVCFDCKEDGSTFIAKKTYHTTIGCSFKQSSTNELYFSVDCENCLCNLGVLDPTTSLYHLFHVLEGSG